MSPGPALKMGPGTHGCPGLRSYIARVMLRRQEGQIIPGLMMIMISLVIVGMLFFQVGRAAVFSTEAQTAADAAALAAAKNIKDQLMRQLATTGTADPELIDPVEVQAAAEAYAAKNGGHPSRPIERHGVDVKVWVSTNATLGDQARDLDKEDTRGEARARA